MELDQMGRTKLMRFIIERNFNYAMCLINTKTSEYLNIQDKHGTTALHIACFFNKKNIIKLLLKNGADPYIKDNNGISLELSKYLIYINPKLEIEKKIKTKQEIDEIENYRKKLDCKENLIIFDKWYLDSLIFEYELWKQKNNIYSSSSDSDFSSDSDSELDTNIFI